MFAVTKRESITQWAEAAQRYAEQCAERREWIGAARYTGEAVALHLLAESVDPREEADPCLNWV